MGIPGDPSFEERRKAAANSKTELLNKFRTAASADDPAVQARLAERKVVADGREARRSERESQKRETARIAAAKLAADADALAAAPAEPEVHLPPTAPAVAPDTEAELDAGKAERDRRYAARKARKR